MDYMSTVSALALTAGDTPSRLTQLTAYALYADRSEPPEVSYVSAITLYDEKTEPVRLGLFTAYALVSIREAAPVVEVEPLANVPTRDVLPERELNPYRPSLPSEVQRVDPVLGDFMSEQSETIREQHNKIQAGDTTAPWEFLAKVGPERQFTLGSLGRFYHDDFGLVMARYVQFTRMRAGVWVNGPVGRLKQDTKMSWQVTNDLEYSSVDDTVGIMPQYDLPANGVFGWVIVDGANTVPLRVEGEVVRASELVWHSQDTVGEGSGRLIGTVIGSPKLFQTGGYLQPGDVRVEVGGYSALKTRELVAPELDAFGQRLEQLNQQLAEVPTQGGINAVQRELTRLAELIGLEVNDRKRADNEIRALIPAPTGGGQLDGILAQIQQIRQQLASIEDRIGGVGTLQDQIDGLLARIVDLESRRSRTLIPVVTGGIPPELVYLPDGSLVFMEIE